MTERNLEFNAEQGYSDILDKIVPEIPEGRNPIGVIESLKNAVKHGNKNKGIVKVIITHAENRTYIAVKDAGQGFNWKEHINHECPNENETCDRGIYLMENSCDKLYYNEKGNIVMIRFDC